MTIKLQRKSFKIGASHAVTLPASWCEYYGDRIDTLTIFGSSVLILAPKGLENVAQSLARGIEEGGAKMT